MLLLSLLFFTGLWIGISKFCFNRQITVKECGIHFSIVFVVITSVIVIGDWTSSSDTELYHGAVVSKEREQGHYQTSYDCNCRCTSRDKNGSCNSESCDTCYTDHYTVTWDLQTTLGSYRVDSVDRTSQSAWSLPDPNEYVTAFPGQPFTKQHTYTNYFLLYKDSLFNNSTALQSYSNELDLAAYPSVSGYYINLVYNQGGANIDVVKYNDILRRYLIKAGAEKQVNIILFFTTIQDQAFRHALEAKWLGGKKNDVIILIGVDKQAPNLTPVWVDAITIGKNMGNEMLQVALREDIMKIPLRDPEMVTNAIFSNIDKYFHRKPMSTWKYMDEARQMPIGLVVFSILFTLVLNITFTVVAIRYDIDN